MRWGDICEPKQYSFPFDQSLEGKIKDFSTKNDERDGEINKQEGGPLRQK
jgi:hypothetical protein